MKAILHEKPLTKLEREHLKQSVETIQANKQATEETFAALSMIRERRLYRETHTNFKDFCAEVLGMDRDWAARVVTGYVAIQELEADLYAGVHAPPDISVDSVKVMKASSARTKVELAKIPRSKRAKVVVAAIAKSKGRAPTAKTVREVAAAVSHKAKHVPSEERTGKLASAAHPVLEAMDDWYQTKERLSAYGPGLTPRGVYNGLRDVVQKALDRSA